MKPEIDEFQRRPMFPVMPGRRPVMPRRHAVSRRIDTRMLVKDNVKRGGRASGEGVARRVADALPGAWARVVLTFQHRDEVNHRIRQCGRRGVCSARGGGPPARPRVGWRRSGMREVMQWE